jgi:hypothetical protein
MGGVNLNVLLAFGFGIVFSGVLLGVAVVVKNPTPLLITVVKIVIALAGAGVAATIPGFLNVEMAPSAGIAVRAGGAIAVFVLVFFFVPAGLIAGVEATPPPPTDHHNIVTRGCGLQFKQRDALLPIRAGKEGEQFVTMRREPFTVLLSKRTWKDSNPDRPVLLVTVSDKPELFSVYRNDSSLFFRFGTSMAEFKHGSGALFTVHDLPAHLSNNSIVGSRFNIDDGLNRGAYVSAIFRPGEPGGINLLQIAKNMYMIFKLVQSEDDYSIDLVRLEFQ